MLILMTKMLVMGPMIIMMLMVIEMTIRMLLMQAEEQKLEMASKTSTEFDSRLADMRREMDECRGEAARVKVEASHLSAALREAEATKKSKDRQITELQQ